MKNTFIPTHGGYRKLLSYEKTEIIYDATNYFTKRFFTKFDRTIDQMYKHRVLVSKTSQKLAWLLPPQRKQRSIN